MTSPEHADYPDLPEPTLGVPDTNALRRRVLLAGVVTIVLFLAIAWLIAWLQVADAWLLIAMVGLWFGVTRPLMRPVRDAIKLRRRLAYHVYLDERNRKEDAS